VLEWINRTDEHFLNFAFKKLFNLFRLNEDYDLAEASDLLPSWTIDGLYYFQFAGEEARLVSIPFLHLLYKTDSRYFYYLMENTRWASALELEEDVLRMRQRRMAEQGFPGLDEAGHVYSPMSDREMKVLQEHATRAPAETESAPSTQPRLRYRFSMEGGDLFAYAALRHIREQRSAEKIQKELINLANTVMIADCVEVREHADKQAAFKKVMGYVSIGLEQASRHDAEGAVRLLEELPVLVLFRAGYSRALDLQSRARSICRELKSIHPRLQPDFFGMPLDDVIAGLSGKRPLYYTGYEEADNSLHREFEKIEDIDDMNRALDEASVIKKVLFDCFALGAPGALEDLTTRSALEDAGDLRALQLFNTALVRHVLYGITGTAPVNASELRQFLSMVLTAGTHAQTVSGRISEALLADTVDWLRRQYRMLEEDVTALKSFVRSCLGRLEEECGALAGADEIEPRYISAVLLLR
jgi:hypothetical protein